MVYRFYCATSFDKKTFSIEDVQVVDYLLFGCCLCLMVLSTVSHVWYIQVKLTKLFVWSFVCVNALHPTQPFSVMSGQFSVFLGCTSTKQRIKCLAWEHKTVLMSLKLATPDLKSNALPTESLCSTSYQRKSSKRVGRYWKSSYVCKRGDQRRS